MKNLSLRTKKVLAVICMFCFGLVALCFALYAQKELKIGFYHEPGEPFVPKRKSFKEKNKQSRTTPSNISD